MNDELCYMDECDNEPTGYCQECHRAGCKKHLVKGHCKEQGCKAKLDARQAEINELRPLVEYLAKQWYQIVQYPSLIGW